MVETTLNYMARMAERPTYYTYEPPAGIPWRNTKGDRRRIAVHDARQLNPAPTLDGAGFALVQLETAADLYDPTSVQHVYFPEVEELVQRSTGASRVLAFDHNIRRGSLAARDERGVQPPVRYAHNDYTVASGPQRVRDLLGDAAAEVLLRHRFAVVNVWKPIRGPVQETPLAVCDARTIDSADLVATDLKYRDRAGEVYSLTFNPTHRWFYFPRMRADEVMLLKCFDSDVDRARFTAHSAFDDPETPADAPTRESIEVRTLVFFPA